MALFKVVEYASDKNLLTFALSSICFIYTAQTQKRFPKQMKWILQKTKLYLYAHEELLLELLH